MGGDEVRGEGRGQLHPLCAHQRRHSLAELGIPDEAEGPRDVVAGLGRQRVTRLHQRVEHLSPHRAPNKREKEQRHDLQEKREAAASVTPGLGRGAWGVERAATTGDTMPPPRAYAHLEDLGEEIARVFLSHAAAGARRRVLDAQAQQARVPRVKQQDSEEGGQSR